VYPPVITPDYFDSIKYTLDNATVTASANITATQLGNGDIQIDVAAGKIPDANPSTGMTIAWQMRDSITGKPVNFGTNAGYQGFLCPWLGVVSGLGGANGIELSIGTANSANLLTASSLGASINDSLNKPIAQWRLIAPANLARTVDAGPTGLSNAVMLDMYKNVSANFYLAGSQPNAIGLSNLDPRLQLTPGNPFDIVLGAGSTSIGSFFMINIRNASLVNVAADRTYVLRPRFLCLDWRA
jgi:hypothetical protein